MAWLALVAVLLLSVMPAVSRALMAVASKSAPVLVEMCTTGGLKLAVTAFPAIDPEPPAHPMAGALDACDYCVLATPLPLVLLLLCLLSLQRVPPQPVRNYFSVLRSLRNTRGLGAQAPPIAL